MGDYHDPQELREMLFAIPTPGGGQRDKWIKFGMAFHASGGDFEAFNAWSSHGDGYDPAAARSAWKSFKEKPSGYGFGTLRKFAELNGWKPSQGEERYRRAADAPRLPRSKPTAGNAAKGEKPQQTDAQRRGIEAYIAEAQSHAADAMEFCKSRSISPETASRFGIGYDPEQKRVVFPYPGSTYYVGRSVEITPNGDHKGQIKYKYPSSEDGGDRQAFNAPRLNDNDGFVCLVEGQIDAITLEQAGVPAIAWGGEGGENTIRAALERFGTTARVFVIIPDNDASGEKQAAKVREIIEEAGAIACDYPPPQSFHDVNDVLCQAPADFDDWSRGAGAAAAQAEADAKAEYQRQSGAGRLEALGEYVGSRKPAISTGFFQLDQALGDGYADEGGISPGLYSIGAMPSLGKTTLALQMADAIAASGRDVLIVALEMSAHELIARSLSRLTTITAKDERDRKTAKGILQGTRYKFYRPSELAAIEDAKRLYSEYASHVYIIEGVGNITVEKIREAAEKHKKITGEAPVLIIDYLQIIAPTDAHATDKQNTDHAVLELKRMSRDLDIAVIAVSSFNRTGYKEGASLEQAKESGGVDYTADVVIHLQLEGAGRKDIKGKPMPFDVDKEKARNPRKIEAVILKNRSGKTGATVKFDYNPAFNRFDAKSAVDPGDPATPGRLTI